MNLKNANRRIYYVQHITALLLRAVLRALH